MSFKFNVDHCLHVFNVLKNGGVQSNNFFEHNKRGMNNNQNNYVYMNSQSRAEYQRSLSLIDLQLNGLFRKKEDRKDRKKDKAPGSSASDQEKGSSSQEDSLNSSEHAPL